MASFSTSSEGNCYSQPDMKLLKCYNNNWRFNLRWEICLRMILTCEVPSPSNGSLRPLLLHFTVAVHDISPCVLPHAPEENCSLEWSDFVFHSTFKGFLKNVLSNVSFTTSPTVLTGIQNVWFFYMHTTFCGHTSSSFNESSMHNQ